MPIAVLQGPKSVSEAEKLSDGYLINLIDSPGHVDFCSEVGAWERMAVHGSAWQCMKLPGSCGLIAGAAT